MGSDSQTQRAALYSRRLIEAQLGKGGDTCLQKKTTRF